MDTKKMNRHFNKNWILILILIIAAWLLGSVTQAVAETKKYRSVAQFSKAEYMPIGDIEGHIFAMFEFRGLVFIDGEVAVFTGWAQGDFIKGVGLVQNYYKLVFEDGSTQVLKSKFTSKLAPDGKTGVYEDGKGEFIMGTGRFAGIKGTDSYTGKRIMPISPGLKEARGDFIIDGIQTYTLPPK
ncbi:MAG: hypothetical protein ABSH06_23625 [Thermodesulfobacteriota bacterium]